MNITRTPWVATPSLPIPDTTYPKKETMTSPRIRDCRPPRPKSPRNRRGRRLPSSESARNSAEYAHKTLLPPRDEVEHDTPIAYRLIGPYHYDTCMHLCPYASSRRCHVVPRATVTDPSPDTIPHIFSPSPSLMVSCPPPFKFTQEPLYFFFLNILLSQLPTAHPLGTET